METTLGPKGFLEHLLARVELALAYARGPKHPQGLVATASGTAAGPIGPLPNMGTTTIVSAAPIAVGAGQKVIVTSSVEYDGGAGNGTSNTVQQSLVSSLSGPVAGPLRQSVFANDDETLARVVELTGLAAGEHTFSVVASVTAAGNPQVNAVNASIVVMVVDV